MSNALLTVAPPALTVAQLHQACDPAQFAFKSTAELTELTELIGQARAQEAVRFGAGIRHDGYNMFVMGPPGVGKRAMVSQFLAQQKGPHECADWCYLNNFHQPRQPLALRLPGGRGVQLRQKMAQLVDELRTAIPAFFESEEYRAKANAIQQEFSQRQEESLKTLSNDAIKQQIILLRTPGGFAFAPTHNDEVLPPDEFAQLPPEERVRIGQAIADLQERLEKILSHFPQWMKDRAERVKQLNRATTQTLVTQEIDALRASFTDLAPVQDYLALVQQDMIDNADDFRKEEDSATVDGLNVVTRKGFHRYQVNVLVNNGAQPGGVPIVSEDNPTYSNLIGRVEHVAQFGALVTDFTLIQPGALHRANGGYLLLDVHKVLAQPFAWEGLKRALQAREIRIEALGQMYSLVSTVSLEPQPMALSVKIVLFGERLFYYLLQQYDPDFAELFKVVADFEDRVERTPETHLLYARLVATVCVRDKLLPLNPAAVARVIEHSARLSGDAQRLSMHLRGVADLLQEADYWSRASALTLTDAAQVQQAIDARIQRRDRLRDRLQEAILRNTLLIDTQGAVVGQINALAVLELGDFAFAQPTRITATTRLGEGQMVNIEREVRLSGAIHSKGVLILSAFLAARYARNQPLALAASLVFEQSYGEVEGDSASLAELCALLSQLANAPLWQSLAVTGSVNQLGQVQAIGAVNEKIEGFFDICVARGLNGDQGVLIPAANVKHLMLRHDVVAAAQAGQFRIHAVAHVDQAISLLTGLVAGEQDAHGAYPVASLNQRVVTRVAQLATLRKAAARPRLSRSARTSSGTGNRS